MMVLDHDDVYVMFQKKEKKRTSWYPHEMGSQS